MASNIFFLMDFFGVANIFLWPISITPHGTRAVPSAVTYFVTNSFRYQKLDRKGSQIRAFPMDLLLIRVHLFRNRLLFPISLFFHTITAPVRYNVHHHCHSSVTALSLITFHQALSSWHFRSPTTNFLASFFPTSITV